MLSVLLWYCTSTTKWYYTYVDTLIAADIFEEEEEEEEDWGYICNAKNGGSCPVPPQNFRIILENRIFMTFFSSEEREIIQYGFCLGHDDFGRSHFLALWVNQV